MKILWALKFQKKGGGTLKKGGGTVPPLEIRPCLIWQTNQYKYVVNTLNRPFEFLI